MARLGEQLLRQRRIVLPAILILGVEELARLRDRKMRQARATTEKRRLYDLLALDGVGDGLAHARIVEWRLGRIEDQIHVGAVDRVEDQFGVFADRLHGLPWDIFDEIDVASL